MKQSARKYHLFTRSIQAGCKNPALRTALICFVLGTFWIFFSDLLVNRLIADQNMAEQLSPIKGMLCVAFISFLCYCLITKQFNKITIHQKHLNHLLCSEDSHELPHKALLKKTMCELMEYDIPFTLVYFDIDNFKTVNDCFGHATGDLLIIAAGKRIKAQLEFEDCLFWVGGDEFVMLKKGISKKNVTEWDILNMLKDIAAPFEIDGKEITVSFSAGVAAYPEDGLLYDPLICHANIAMFAAKEAGIGGCKFYTHEYSLALQNKSQLEADIRKGILNHEFELYYQPIVCLKTGRIYSLEALARWCHPQKGPISPKDFIPVAEESGLIIPLGENLMQMGMIKAARLAISGVANVAISINISAKQLSDPDFCDMVERQLHQTGAMGSNLIFEITESFVINDIPRKILVLNRLKAHGIRISIDDFGTGYSSLTYLSQLPVDMVKIDRSFVSKLQNCRINNITNAIIALSHQLALKVVAEGVETEEQKALLQANGCDYIQGYLIAPPVPADELALI